ncbi:MAG: hypothetical protein IH851_05045 [Armatimonadetes bacterium]|nr:hypothetical protein [Armatimonadota bacterium]
MFDLQGLFEISVLAVEKFPEQIRVMFDEDQPIEERREKAKSVIGFMEGGLSRVAEEITSKQTTLQRQRFIILTLFSLAPGGPDNDRLHRLWDDLLPVETEL